MTMHRQPRFVTTRVIDTEQMVDLGYLVDGTVYVGAVRKNGSSKYILLKDRRLNVEDALNDAYRLSDQC